MNMNKKTVLIISCSFCLVLVIFSGFVSFRTWMRDTFLSQKRVVLAKADGFLTKDMPITVIKVVTSETLSLEVYVRKDNSDDLQFFKRIILPEKRDGFFTFRGNATNLVLTDLDGDGNIEILAPSYDENLIPRLNVYSYDPESNSFHRKGAS